MICAAERSRNVSGQGIRLFAAGRTRALLLALLLSACLWLMPDRSAAITSDSAEFYAHRGLSAMAPDDSIAAFELAAAAGFYGIDCDLWPTARDASGHFDIAISHVDNLKEIAGIDRRISAMTAEEVRNTRIIYGDNIEEYPDEYIPLISEFFDIASRDGLHVIVEMKGAKWTKAQCRKLLKTIRRYDMADMTIVNSLYIGNLERIQECARGLGLRVQTMYTIYRYEDMNKKLKLCKKAGVPIASMLSTHILSHKKKVFKAYQKYGIGILSWTAGETHEKKAARRLIKCGVRSIVTNTRVFD